MAITKITRDALTPASTTIPMRLRSPSTVVSGSVRHNDASLTNCSIWKQHEHSAEARNDQRGSVAGLQLTTQRHNR